MRVYGMIAGMSVRHQLPHKDSLVPKTLPLCARCGRTVAVGTVEYDFIGKRSTYRFYCHGASQEAVVSELDFANAHSIQIGECFV